MSDSTQFVRVTVVNDVVVCQPDPVLVSGSNVLLLYHLATDGYIFPATDAVTVSQPGGSFPHPSNTINDLNVSLLDTVEQKGDFAYTVTVVHQASGRRFSVDPTIRNEN